jgi:hypothetical protein
VSLSPPHLRTETDPVSETFFRIPDDVQKPSNSECYTPLSEPFKIYLLSLVYLYKHHLINTSQRRHIHSLSPDSTGTTNTCRVFPRSRVDNCRHQNLQWILKWQQQVPESETAQPFMKISQLPVTVSTAIHSVGYFTTVINCMDPQYQWDEIMFM